MIVITSLVLVKQVIQSSSPQIMGFDFTMNGIVKELNDLYKIWDLEKMESKCILFSWEVEISTVHTIPDRNISCYLS